MRRAMPLPMLPSPMNATVATFCVSLRRLLPIYREAEGSGDMTWCESGGTGSRAFLLLHGLGATAAVWTGVRRVIEERAMGRWVAPDLSGHGDSAWERQYTVGSHAAEVAELVRGTEELFVIGHSLGTYIGLALASR